MTAHQKQTCTKARQDIGLEPEAPKALLCGKRHVILNGKCADLPAHSVGDLC